MSDSVTEKPITVQVRKSEGWAVLRLLEMALKKGGLEIPPGDRLPAQWFYDRLFHELTDNPVWQLEEPCEKS